MGEGAHPAEAPCMHAVAKLHNAVISPLGWHVTMESLPLNPCVFRHPHAPPGKRAHGAGVGQEVFGQQRARKAHIGDFAGAISRQQHCKRGRQADRGGWRWVEGTGMAAGEQVGAGVGGRSPRTAGGMPATSTNCQVTLRTIGAFEVQVHGAVIVLQQAAGTGSVETPAKQPRRLPLSKRDVATCSKRRQSAGLSMPHLASLQHNITPTNTHLPQHTR